MNNEFSAKTIEEAVNLGLKELNLTIDQVEYVVLEQPTKGIFGIGSKNAKISMTKKKTDADLACDFLDGLFEILNVTATTKLESESDEKIVINLVATDSSSLIGYRGEVLDSLQTLAGAVANKQNENYKRVVVDCENYREKREKTLQSLAEKLANKAIKTGRKITLEPMNPFERRIIHSRLSEFEGVQTVSEGKEPARYIAIIPDGYDPSKAERRPFRKGSGSRPGDRRSGGKKPFKKEKSEMITGPKKSGFGGGVFLGNSLKDSNDD